MLKRYIFSNDTEKILKLYVKYEKGPIHIFRIENSPQITQVQITAKIYLETRV